MQCTMGPKQIKKFGCLSNVNKQLSLLHTLQHQAMIEVMTRSPEAQDLLGTLKKVSLY